MARGSCLTERRGCGQHSVARAVGSPGHTRLGKDKEREEVGENRHRSEAVLAADGGSNGDWIGIRMMHEAE